MVTRILGLLLAVAAATNAHAQQVKGKCIATPLGSVLLRTADGKVLHIGNVPNAVPLAGVDDATAVAAYGKWWLILRRDGSVLEIRDGAAPKPAPGVHNAIDIAVGGGHAAALLADGTVRVWRYGGEGPAQPNPTDLNNVVSIASGRRNIFAVTREGEVRGWGHDFEPRIDAALLGGAKVERAFTQMPVAAMGVANAVDVRTHNYTTLARSRDGSWKVWGAGAGSIPIAAPSLKGAVQVINDAALFADGSVKAWSAAKIGTSIFPDRAVAISGEEIITIERNNVALLADGRVVLWGNSYFYEHGPGVIAKVDEKTVAECSAL